MSKSFAQRRGIKLAAALMALVVACAVGFGVFSANENAPASEAAVPATGTLVAGPAIDLDGASTNLCTIDDMPAVNVTPARAVPASGEYPLVSPPAPPQQSSLSVLKAVLWCSYGAPGFDETYYPTTYFDGTPMTAEKYQVATYVMASYVYNMGWGNATDGAGDAFTKWADTLTDEYLNKVRGQIMEVPSNFTLVEIQGEYPSARVLSYLPGGWVSATVASSSAAVSDNNKMYSLDGASYMIYEDQACTKPVGELVATDGATNKIFLPTGTYYIKQRNAGTGYALSGEVSAIEVGNGTQTDFAAECLPLLDAAPLTVLLRDANHAEDNSGNDPQGAASLNGARYKVSYYDEEIRFATDGATKTPLWTKTISAAWNGTSAIAAPTASDMFSNGQTSGWPVGYYIVEQVSEPQAGYAIDDKDPYVFSILPNGGATKSSVIVGSTLGNRNDAISASNPLISADQVFRGDISIVRYTTGGGTTGQVPAAGVRYNIVNNNDYSVYNPTTGAWVPKGGVVYTLTTSDEGYASTKTYGNNTTGSAGHLAYGSYIVEEDASSLPAGTQTVGNLSTSIMLNGQTRFFTLDETAGATIRVNKVDKDAYDAGRKVLVSGGTQFRIVNSAGVSIAFNDEFPVTNKLTTLTTDNNGQLVLPSKLPAGTYRIEEVQAPYGYLRNTTPVSFTVPASAATSTSYATPLDVYLPDSITMGKLTITNKDAEHDAAITGASAKYQVIAAEDIITPDGTSRTQAGDVVADNLSTTNGVVETGALYCGKYIVKQVSAPEGYLADSTEYPVEITYINDTTPVANVAVSTYNQPVKGHISASKTDAVSGKVVPVLGTMFDVVADENIVGKDGHTWYSAGQTVDTIITNADGIAIGSRNLPLGNYRIVEKSAPAPYILNTTPTKVALAYKDSATAIVETTGSVADQRAETVFKVSKRDAETHKLVLTGNCRIGVYAAEDIVMPEGSVVFSKDQEVDVITTDATGYGTGTKKAPVGNYYLKEISAPSGYVLDETSTSPCAFIYPGQDVADSVTESSIEDMPQKGTITFSKVDASTGKPVPVAGIKAEIFANEDITTGDGTVRYTKDQRVADLTTGEDGTATSGSLYLGSYRVVETLAPEGYLLNETPVNVSLSYGDQTVPVISAAGTISDENAMGVIEVEKIDKETGKVIEVAGTTFEVRAKTDITTPDGTVRVKAGEEACPAISTDGSGKAKTQPLYLGTYTVTEVEAPEGYVLDFASQDVTLAYKDQNTAVVFSGVTIANTAQKGVVTLTKKDVESDEPILVAGATFDVIAAEEIKTADGTVRAAAGDVVDTIKTDETGKAQTKALYLGRYDFRETKAPTGYILNEATSSVLLEYGDVHEPIVYTDTDMTDVPVKGVISLKVFDVREKNIPLTSTWEVVAAEDIKTPDGVIHHAAGDVVDTISTTDEDKAGESDPLYLGKYLLRQVAQTTGYQRDTENRPVTLSYVDDKTPVIVENVTLYNTPTDLQLTKISEEGRPLTDTEFLAWDTQGARDFKGFAVYSYEAEIKNASIVKTSELDNVSPNFETAIALSKSDDMSNELYDVFSSDESVTTGNYRLHVEYVTPNDNKEYALDETFAVNEYDDTAIFLIGEYTGYDMKNRFDSSLIGDDANENNVPEEMPAEPEEISIPMALANNDASSNPVDSDGPVAPEEGDENTDTKDEDNNGETSTDSSDDNESEQGKDEEEETANRSELLTAPSGICHRVPVVLIDCFFATSHADENGVAEFRYIYPDTKAAVVESQALDGFASDRRISYFDVDNAGYITDSQLAENAQLIDGELVYTNFATKVLVSKTATETGTELPGNTLSVFSVASDGTETLVDSWVSDVEPHEMRELSAGNYVLREETPAEGYSQADAVSFRVNDTAAIQHISMDNTLLPVVPPADVVIGQLGAYLPVAAIMLALIAAGVIGIARYRRRRADM